MYGYDIPCYAREYLRSWRRNDRFLRLRWSLDTPGKFILERKTRWISDHPFTRGTDYQVQLKDDYRHIVTFGPQDIGLVADFLRSNDVQAQGGANALADRLNAADDARREAEDRALRNEFEAKSSEAYDSLAWREGRRIAV